MPDLSRSASITIDAPPAQVFDILADPRQHPRIDGSGSVRRSLSGPERLSLGAEFGMDMRLAAPYRIKNRVVEFEEGRRIAWRHFAPHRWRYELEPVGAGQTRVTETWDVSRYNRVGQVYLRLTRFPARNQRGIERTLERLKEAAEQDARET